MTGLLALLWKPIAAILALLGIYAAGPASARQKARTRAAEGYVETRKKADDAEIVGDDPNSARRWLRERAKRDGDL